MTLAVAISLLGLALFVYVLYSKLSDLSRQVDKIQSDIHRLVEMDYEIAKTIDSHFKAITNLNNAMEYVVDREFEKDPKIVKKSNNIFEPPHGEA